MLQIGVGTPGMCLACLPACFARGSKCRMTAFDRHTQADPRRQEARSPGLATSRALHCTHHPWHSYARFAPVSSLFGRRMMLQRPHYPAISENRRKHV
jgi:hypothetical protein